MQNPDSINLHWQFRSKHAHSRLSEVLLSAYRLLLRHPEAGSVELQAKLLKRASPYQVTPEGSLAVQLELGRLLYAHKNARADAYDLLSSLSKIPDSEVGKLLETERLALLARIRIDQLEDTMAHVAQGRGGNSLLSGQGYSQHLWSAGGRAVRQLYDEAQSLLGTTIKLQPHRMDNIVLRMALFWSKGQKEAARELADTFLSVNKDKDAVAIRLALCIESFVADKDEANVEQLYKLLKLSSDLLQIDPQCLASLKGVS